MSISKWKGCILRYMDSTLDILLNRATVFWRRVRSVETERDTEGNENGILPTTCFSAAAATERSLLFQCSWLRNCCSLLGSKSNTQTEEPGTLLQTISSTLLYSVLQCFTLEKGHFYKVKHTLTPNKTKEFCIKL